MDDSSLNLAPSTTLLKRSAKPQLSPKKAPGSAMKVHRLTGKSISENPLFQRPSSKKSNTLGWIDLDRKIPESHKESTLSPPRRLRDRKPKPQLSKLTQLIDSDSGNENQEYDSDISVFGISDGSADDDIVPVLVPTSLKLRDDMDADTTLRMNWIEPRKFSAPSRQEDTTLNGVTQTMQTTSPDDSVPPSDSIDHSHFDISEDIYAPPSVERFRSRATQSIGDMPISPSKISKMPKPNHGSASNAFWDKDFIDDWNDKYGTKLDLSPSKPTKPTVKPTQSKSLVKSIGCTVATKEAKKNFEANKDQLAKQFFAELDNKITNGQISELTKSTGGVSIVWSNRLNTTAGRANWKRKITKTTHNGQSDTVENQHIASVELASKVIDNEERLLNVIAHEFCHLCNFMINGITNNPHGKEFKVWASQVSIAFSHRGIEVTTKHTYDINFKYVWECTSCLLEYKRHSKSINSECQRCGRCKSPLIQTRPTPRASSKPSEYQIFMKTEMKRLKEQNPGLKHTDIMKMVGNSWAKKSSAAKTKPIGMEVVEIPSDSEAEPDVSTAPAKDMPSSTTESVMHWSDNENEEDLLAAQLNGLTI